MGDGGGAKLFLQCHGEGGGGGGGDLFSMDSPGEGGGHFFRLSGLHPPHPPPPLKKHK